MNKIHMLYYLKIAVLVHFQCYLGFFLNFFNVAKPLSSRDEGTLKGNEDKTVRERGWDSGEGIGK